MKLTRDLCLEVGSRSGCSASIAFTKDVYGHLGSGRYRLSGGATTSSVARSKGISGVPATSMSAWSQGR
jgi:hypothetical protein